MIETFTAYTTEGIITKLPEECPQFSAIWDVDEEHWEVSYIQPVSSDSSNRIA